MAAKLAGSGGGGRYQVEQNSEINVTPFVDVMLVLLIIFMVAAPLASVNVELKLPAAVAKPRQNPPKAVIGEDLRKQVGKRDPQKERIFIRADKETRYGAFMQVMNALQDNGFYSVALIGQDDSRAAGG